MSEKKLKFSFSADESLLYLIQQTVYIPSEEILGFFYDLGIRVAQIGSENMNGGRGIRKDIRDCYPGTYIPFKLLVVGKHHYYHGDKTLFGSIEVSFPDSTRTVNHEALLEKIVERTLLDGESLPDFPQPKSKTPKLYKDLINEVIGNKSTIQKHEKS